MQTFDEFVHSNMDKYMSCRMPFLLLDVFSLLYWQLCQLLCFFPLVCRLDQHQKQDLQVLLLLVSDGSSLGFINRFCRLLLLSDWFAACDWHDLHSFHLQHASDVSLFWQFSKLVQYYYCAVALSNFYRVLQYFKSVDGHPPSWSNLLLQLNIVFFLFYRFHQKQNSPVASQLTPAIQSVSTFASKLAAHILRPMKSLLNSRWTDSWPGPSVKVSYHVWWWIREKER